MIRIVITAGILALTAVVPSMASAQQIKIAALAPDGSSWMESLKAAGDRIEQGSDGAVRIRFYPAGVMGDADPELTRHFGDRVLALADISAECAGRLP